VKIKEKREREKKKTTNTEPERITQKAPIREVALS